MILLFYTTITIFPYFWFCWLAPINLIADGQPPSKWTSDGPNKDGLAISRPKSLDILCAVESLQNILRPSQNTNYCMTLEIYLGGRISLTSLSKYVIITRWVNSLKLFGQWNARARHSRFHRQMPSQIPNNTAHKHIMIQRSTTRGKTVMNCFAL
jgi:hypothetical protein